MGARAGIPRIEPLAAKHGAGTLEPKDLRARAVASQWMDWQLTVVAPAIHDAFWGLIRVPAEKRNHAAIDASKRKTAEVMRMFDAHLAKHAYAAGDVFSMGDIPVGVMTYRFRALVPERPAMPHLDRWYAALETREAFRAHVASIPLT